MVEPGVVGVGEDDDDLPLPLDDLLEGDAVLLEHLGTDQAGLVPHEVGAPEMSSIVTIVCAFGITLPCGHVRKELSGRLLQEVAVLRRDTVPGLGGTVVQKVYGIEILCAK